jgi:hypothetical protein
MTRRHDHLAMTKAGTVTGDFPFEFGACPDIRSQAAGTFVVTKASVSRVVTSFVHRALKREYEYPVARKRQTYV